jgi:hypothetical protein
MCNGGAARRRAPRGESPRRSAHLAQAVRAPRQRRICVAANQRARFSRCIFSSKTSVAPGNRGEVRES